MDRQRKLERKARKQRQKKDKAKAFDKRKSLEAKRRSEFPQIVVNSEGADERFIALVKEAVAKIDFRDPSQFPKWLQEAYRLLASHGAEYAINAVQQASLESLASGDESAKAAMPLFNVILGERIFGLISEDQRRRYLPYNDMRVYPEERRLVIRFTRLESRPSPNGRVYFSRHRPTISLDGTPYIVAFSRHSIERVCERLNPRWLTYAAAGDVHAVFSHCRHYDPVTLYGDQPAFAMYDYCDNEGFVHYNTYISQIIGEENFDRSNGHAYYRVGYCPVAIEGEFARAKTFLYPGFTGTPEFGAILTSSLPTHEKRRLKQMAMENDANKTIVENEVEAIRWFHHNGVPQVIQTHSNYFRYD